MAKDTMIIVSLHSLSAKLTSGFLMKWSVSLLIIWLLMS